MSNPKSSLFFETHRKRGKVLQPIVLVDGRNCRPAGGDELRHDLAFLGDVEEQVDE